MCLGHDATVRQHSKVSDGGRAELTEKHGFGLSLCSAGTVVLKPKVIPSALLIQYK